MSDDRISAGEALAFVQAKVGDWHSASMLLINLARIGELVLTARRLRHVDEVQIQDAAYQDEALGNEELERAELWSEADWRAGLFAGPLLLRNGMSYVASGVTLDRSEVVAFVGSLSEGKSVEQVAAVSLPDLGGRYGADDAFLVDLMHHRLRAHVYGSVNAAAEALAVVASGSSTELASKSKRLREGYKRRYQS